MKPVLNILFLLLAAHMAVAQAPARTSEEAPALRVQVLSDYFMVDTLEVYSVAEGMDCDRGVKFYVLNSSVPYVQDANIYINDTVSLDPSEYTVYDEHNIFIFDRDAMIRILECYDGQYSDNPRCGPDEFLEQVYIQFELAMIKDKLMRTAVQNEWLDSLDDNQAAPAEAYLAEVDIQINIDNLQALISDVDQRVARLRMILAD